MTSRTTPRTRGDHGFHRLLKFKQINSLVTVAVIKNFHEDIAPSESFKLFQYHFPRVAYRIAETQLSDLIKSVKDCRQQTICDTVMQYALHAAASHGHCEIVRLLLAAGAIADTIDDHQDTPLHYAALYGHHKVVEVLLRAGAQVDRIGHKQSTALHRASSFAGHSGSVNVLLTAGASVSAVDEDGWTALHHAASAGNTETMQLLLAYGANVHAVSVPRDNRRAAIHIAAAQGHWDAVTALLSAGSTVNVEDANRKKPLYHAAAHGCHQVIALLL